jgi:RNA polymerase sigma factor (sigma-70 family)
MTKRASDLALLPGEMQPFAPPSASGIVMDREPEEYELALRARNGDRSALAALVERTRLRLFALAYTELRHYEDAQDAVAAALLQICLHVTELREPERIRAWMQSVVRNEVRRLRRGAGAVTLPLDDAEGQAGETTPSLLRVDIECALRRLPLEQAGALRMFYLEDVPIREIVQRTGHPEGTIKSWLHRGRRFLATQMQEYTPMPPVQTTTAAIVHTDLEPALVRKLTAALRALGYETKVVKPRNLSSLAETLKSYQYLLLDEWIAGRSAFELLLHLREVAEIAGIPITLLSADPSEFTAASCWLAGIDRLVNKKNPAELSQLGEPLAASLPPAEMPLIAVRDRAFFPEEIFPLFVGRARSVQAVQAARSHHRYVLVVAQRDAAVDDPAAEDLYSIGTAARVIEVRSSGDSIRVMLEGTARARVAEYLQTDPFFQVRAVVLSHQEERSSETEALMRRVVVRLQETVASGRMAFRGPHLDADRVARFLEMGQLADRVTPHLNLPVMEQQALLETLSARERLEKVEALLD